MRTKPVNQLRAETLVAAAGARIDSKLGRKWVRRLEAEFDRCVAEINAQREIRREVVAGVLAELDEAAKKARRDHAR